MIKIGDILADMHTHTNFSLHAYSTVKENIDMAKKRGLKYLAITDHYYNDGSILDKKNEISRIAYLEERVNPFYSDINIIGGEEFNLNQEINDWNKIKALKWKPIGLHNWFVDTKNCNLDDIYHMFEKSSEKHNCFVHIERELHKLNNGEYMINQYTGKEETCSLDFQLWLEAICILAKEKDIFLELNESSLILDEGYTAERVEYWLKFAKENGNLISLGTDAHYCMEVGRFSNVLKLLNKVKFPKERILNCNEEMLKNL